jgi:single-stranded-DNA-specific exonuclease
MGFREDVQAGARSITAHDKVTIISHIDADGIAGEAILAQALSREEIRIKSVFIRQLEPIMMRLIPSDDSLKLFVDLGAGQQNLLYNTGLDEDKVIIVDHHVSQPCERAYMQVNCLPYGYNKLSAAGVAYFIAREIDSANEDLAKLAIIGNVGDMMAREGLGLTGPAREIVEDGVKWGNVRVFEKDLNCYGTSTRPLHICLSYSDDPCIPGISNNQQGTLRFLQRLGIPLQDDEKRWLVWEELSWEAKRKVTSALVQQLVLYGEPVDRLFTESYIFPDENGRSPLRNANEFATVLNACGRWAKPAVGGAICRGDRGGAYREAEHMLTNHRAVIRDLLRFILDTGVEELTHIQHIHVGNRFPDTIVGIGAGMALSKLNREKPILILCELPEDSSLTKVSMRASERMVSRGVDLQRALNDAATSFGGAGGGHRIAAGAFIPKECEEKFIHEVNYLLSRQYAQPGQGHC